MSLSDPRFVSLCSWLNQYFKDEVTPELICGDASFRRYFTVNYNNARFIVADSPIDLVPISPFISVANAYKKAGIRVPTVLHACYEQGFTLQTDEGNTQLLSVLKNENVVNYYQDALTILPTIASVTVTESGPLPTYDDSFVLRELQIFIDWLLNKHLNLPLDQQNTEMLQSVFTLLIDSACEQPKVGMHRDYHSRNLLLNSAHQLAVIDFQDAVIGPVTYDAVSLLRDCYIRWPDESIEQLMQFHYQLMLSHQLINSDVTLTTYKKWFDFMGIQRHIKAAGIFARLYYRDGKNGYMKDIPLTLEYIIDIAGRYDELVPFSEWVKKVVLPQVLSLAKGQNSVK